MTPGGFSFPLPSLPLYRGKAHSATGDCPMAIPGTAAAGNETEKRQCEPFGAFRGGPDFRLWGGFFLSGFCDMIGDDDR